MSRPLFRTILAAMFVLALAAGTFAQTRAQGVFVHVANTSGTPIGDLRGPDFHVTQDGASKQVLQSTYAGNPARVVLLVDSSDAIQPLINPLRAGLETFIDGMPEDVEVVLVTMGGQLRVRVEPTSDHAKLKEGVKNLFTDNANPVLLDALLESYQRFLSSVETRSPVFVIVTTESPEASHTQEEAFNRFVSMLATHAGVAHALVVGSAATGTNTRPTAGGRSAIDNQIEVNDTSTQSIVSMNITKRTGGRYQYLNSATALPNQLKAIASEIAQDRQRMRGWHQIFFATDKNGIKGLRVDVAQPDVKISLSETRPRNDVNPKGVK